jgi:hypothetical protein
VLGALAALTLAACAGNQSINAASTSPTGCSATLSPGQNVNEALSSAQAGAVVCLRAGSYPALKLTDVRPSGYVTLRSADARAASLAGIEGQRVAFLRLENLTVRGPVEMVQEAHDIQLVGDDIGESACGIYLYAWQGSVISNVTIAHSYIHDLDFTGPEGVCSGYGVEAVGGVNDVLLTDNTIAHVANDYVQLGGGANWTVAHNLFLGPSLRYGHTTVHQDLWQVFGGGSNLRFLNNVARDTATQESLLFQLGVYHDVTVSNNLFDHDSSGYSVQMFQVEGLTFTYNTFVGSHWGVVFRADDPNAGPGRGYVVEHNIFGATSGGTPDVSEWRSFGTYDYNVSQDGSASGPHSVRYWRSRWASPSALQGPCLPFAAGYSATSSSTKGTFSRQWRSGCS